MCGFVGIHQLCHEPVSIDEAIASIKHRGPDSDGSCALPWGEGTLHLGHVRLSIIDPRADADQPMSDKTGRIWIAFNGEIYNYQELRRELEEEGVRFRTTSDTEVLLYLYDRRGIDFVQALKGMFAISLVDLNRQLLLLIRDRFGKKPLYYHHSGQRLIFSSEIKGILSQLPSRPDVDLQALRESLSLLAPLPPRTFFAGVRKLEAGHLMLVENGRIREPRRYYDPLDQLTTIAPEADWRQLLERQLIDAVRYRLVADVEVGVFLSGGLDSSLVTALYKELSPKRIHTFSIGYAAHRERYDETDHAQTVARHLGTEHHPLQVGERDFREVLDQLIYHLDEPINDPAAIPTFLLSRWVREHGIKVCLSGEGSDEIFLGYSVYQLLDRCYAQQWSIGDTAGAAGLFVSAKKADCFVRRRQRGEEPYRSIGEYFCLGETDVRGLLSPETLRNTTGPERWLDGLRRRFDGRDLEPLNWASYIDIKQWIAEVLMMKVDKMAMAHGLEVRVPFLDQQLVRFALALPVAVKTNKQLLKQVAEKYLPATIVGRRKKGFSSPFSEWLFEALGEEILTPIRKVNRQRNWFDDRALMTHFEQGRSGRNKHAIWGLFLIAKWCERYDMV